MCLHILPKHLQSADAGLPVSNPESFSFPLWFHAWPSRAPQAHPLVVCPGVGELRRGCCGVSWDLPGLLPPSLRETLLGVSEGAP